MSRHRDLLATLNRWPRRVLAALCLVLAAASASASHTLAAGHRAEVPPGVAVVVASRDVAAGAILTSAQVRVDHWPRALCPSDALPGVAAVLGKRVAGPLRRGDPVTSSRLVGPGLAATLPPGQVAIAVQLVDNAAGTFISVGDHVDLFAAPADPGGVSAGPAHTQTLAENALVLALVDGNRNPDSPTGPRLIIAADHATAIRVAACAACSVLAVLEKPP